MCRIYNVCVFVAVENSIIIIIFFYMYSTFDLEIQSRNIKRG